MKVRQALPVTGELGEDIGKLADFNGRTGAEQELEHKHTQTYRTLSESRKKNSTVSSRTNCTVRQEGELSASKQENSFHSY